METDDLILLAAVGVGSYVFFTKEGKKAVADTAATAGAIIPQTWGGAYEAGKEFGQKVNADYIQPTQAGYYDYRRNVGMEIRKEIPILDEITFKEQYPGYSQDLWGSLRLGWNLSVLGSIIPLR